MSLVDKGYRVRVVLDTGETVHLSELASLHDKTGKTWAPCSVLFAPFTKTGEPATDDEIAQTDARGYLGRTHVVRKGWIDPPPRSLGEWTRVGSVRRIFYTRTGTKHPGRWQHPFGLHRLFPWPKEGREPVLYKRGALYRLELGADCILDDRGYVWP